VSESKHTQGPWHWNGNRLVSEVQQCMTDVVAEVTNVNNPHDFSLIAAAPEMLAALEWIMSEVAGCQRDEKYEAARAAIAKAKGE
jgi:hypothetical protein